MTHLENSLGSACYRGSAEEVESLIASGANVKSKNQGGDTALHQAMWGNCNHEKRCKVIDILLGNGADIDAQDATGATSMYLAALYGNIALVKYLRSKGGDRNCAENVKRYGVDSVERQDLKAKEIINTALGAQRREKKKTKKQANKISSRDRKNSFYTTQDRFVHGCNLVTCSLPFSRYRNANPLTVVSTPICFAFRTI